jgi:tRNA threonylcarbamoyl adenosine modification protein (Sua5/YciO/YrdC/YwlC family)
MHYFKLHAENPQKRVIDQSVEILRSGGVMVYPTDSAYALGCVLDNRAGIESIRQVRDLKENHPLTLICSDLSQVGRYAIMDDVAFKLIKKLSPGPYTFLLKATKEIPKVAQGAKRKEVGIRIPNHAIALNLVEKLNEPILSSTLWFPNEEEPIYDLDELPHHFQKKMDLILDGGACVPDATTIIDLLGPTPKIVRKGVGFEQNEDLKQYE